MFSPDIRSDTVKHEESLGRVWLQYSVVSMARCMAASSRFTSMESAFRPAFLRSAFTLSSTWNA